MKTNFTGPIRGGAGQRGSAVLILLLFLSIMLLLVAENNRTTNWMRRRIKLVEKEQMNRLATPVSHPSPIAAGTNRISSP